MSLPRILSKAQVTMSSTILEALNRVWVEMYVYTHLTLWVFNWRRAYMGENWTKEIWSCRRTYSMEYLKRAEEH